MDVKFKSRVVVAVLLIYGVYSTVGGLLMIFAPGFVFGTVGGFGIRNGHYIFDMATFELPLGLMCLVAVRCPSWQVPTLAFATLHYVLHSISHLVDIGNSTTPWIGVFDFVVLAVGTVVHALALWFSVQVARAPTTRP